MTAYFIYGIIGIIGYFLLNLVCAGILSRYFGYIYYEKTFWGILVVMCFAWIVLSVEIFGIIIDFCILGFLKVFIITIDKFKKGFFNFINFFLNGFRLPKKTIEVEIDREGNYTVKKGAE